jgi:hypothetical protein
MTIPTPPDLAIGLPQRTALGYRDNPKLRALVEGIGSFVPIVSGVNTYIVERLSALERQRTEDLFRYLDECGAVLTPEMIEIDDFLHCFTITMRAAQRTRRNEKIRLFARLLTSATRGEDVTDVDEYEELLSLLDELSYREICVLAILDRFLLSDQPDWSEDGRKALQDAAQAFWPDFMQTVVSEAAVKPDEVGPLLNRLGQSGLHHRSMTWNGNPEGRGYLTPRYYRLRDLIADADGNLSV